MGWPSRSLCRAAAATWRPVSFCPHRKAPEGLASLPSARGTFNSMRCLEAEWGRAYSITQRCCICVCPGPSSRCATYIHLWAHSSMPCTCQCADMHAAGIQDLTCVCAYSFHTRASPHMDTHHTCGCCRALHVGRLPMCSPLHSYVCATCICGHAFFTGVCVCMLHSCAGCILQVS